MRDDVGSYLQQAIAAFRLGEPIRSPEAVSEAWSNDVFRVITADGSYAIKLFPAGMSTGRREQLRTGMAFEGLVLEDGRIPIPRPISTAGDAQSWLVAIEGPSGPRLARCHEWVSGTQPAETLSSDQVRAAGRYLGILHALDRSDGDTSQLPSFDTERWAEAVRAAAEHQLGWAPQLKALTPLVDRLACDLEELRVQRRPMWVSHRDFDPKNTVIDQAGRLVVADWDYAGAVLPGVELIVAATSFANAETGVKQFIDAYRKAGGKAGPADRLALTAEAADVDWLLRNVEASIAHESVNHSEEYRTAADLIASFSDDVDLLFDWPDRLNATGS